MSNWPSEQFNPLELTLDPLNPRIEVPENASQADIISAMFEYEEIVELANKIAAEGMLPGERIIVTRENGFVMVLEVKPPAPGMFWIRISPYSTES